MPVNERVVVDTFLRVLDLGGTFVFAVSGGAAGVRHRLDLFGVLVLSFVAANFGGITRDVLIGAVPPAAISDWRYIAMSIVAGVVTFYWYPATTRQRTSLLVFDAIGLSLFAVVGTQKALAYHLGPVASTVLGMVTGIGGGLVRDVLVRDVPTVFRAEIYAVAALAGSVVVVTGDVLQLASSPVAVLGAIVCFGLRMVSIRRGWNLPVAPAALED